MNKKTFSLVSVGYKILSVLLSSIFICLTAVLFYFKAVWYAIVFSCVITLICLVATLLCFLNKIVLDLANRQIQVCSLKKYKFNLDELESIMVDVSNSVDKKKYCFIVIKTTGGTDLRISGFACLLHNKAVYYSQCVIDNLNASIQSL